MFTVKTSGTFAAAHRLMYHKGLCRNIHGHNYRVDVMVTVGNEVVQAQPPGMVCDFAYLKVLLSKAIDWYDHSVILNIEDREAIDAIQGIAGMRVREFYREPTAENFAELFFNTLSESLCMLFPCSLAVRVWETEKSYAEFSGSVVQ